MKNLTIITQGVNGGSFKNSKNGYVATFIDNDKIMSIDNYTGTGERFQQRENPVICIFEGGQNCIFEGSKEQLIEAIKNGKK